MANESLIYHPSNVSSPEDRREYQSVGGSKYNSGKTLDSTSYSISEQPHHNTYQSYVPASTHIHTEGTAATGRILNERMVEKMVRLPKRIIREEIVEEPFMVKETIVEIAKPVITEKIVEVPEVEYRDKIKEVVERIVEEKIKEVPKIEYCERIIEVPKIITQKKIVECPRIEYRDVITEKVVEIPEIHQNVILKEVEIPTYVDDKGQPVEQPIYEIERKIPVPVEAITTYEYQLAKFRPRVTKVQYPMFVPRFIPVPAPAESIDSTKLAHMLELSASVNKLVAPQAIGLHEVEELAADIRNCDYVSQLPDANEAQRVIREKWLTGQLQAAAADQTVETKMF